MWLRFQGSSVDTALSSQFCPNQMQEHRFPNHEVIVSKPQPQLTWPHQETDVIIACLFFFPPDERTEAHLADLLQNARAQA